MFYTDYNQSVLASLLFLGVYVCVLSKPECEFISPCACKLSGLNDSGIIDLSYLSRDFNSSTPRFDTVDQKNWHYSFSPCKPFNIFSEINTTTVQRCHNSMVARWTNIGAVPECMSIGDPEPAVFSYDADSGVSVQYSNKTSTGGTPVIRKAFISLVCNANMSANHSIFTLIKIDDPNNSYHFSLESPCCCPDGCPRSPTPTSSPGPKDNQISEETVVIIALVGLLLFIVAIVAGFIIARRSATNQTERQPLITA